MDISLFTQKAKEEYILLHLSRGLVLNDVIRHISTFSDSFGESLKNIYPNFLWKEKLDLLFFKLNDSGLCFFLSMDYKIVTEKHKEQFREGIFNKISLMISVTEAIEYVIYLNTITEALFTENELYLYLRCLFKENEILDALSPTMSNSFIVKKLGNEIGNRFKRDSDEKDLISLIRLLKFGYNYDSIIYMYLFHKDHTTEELSAIINIYKIPFTESMIQDLIDIIALKRYHLTDILSFYAHPLFSAANVAFFIKSINSLGKSFQKDILKHLPKFYDLHEEKTFFLTVGLNEFDYLETVDYKLFGQIRKIYLSKTNKKDFLGEI